MQDEEIGREIIRVLGASPSPLKAHDIRTRIGVRCSKQDVNRVLYKKKEHLEVELANPGQTPPLWRLKGAQPGYSAAVNPGPPPPHPQHLPYQTGGVALTSVSPHPQAGGGMAHPGLPHQQLGVIPATPPLIGGVATSPLPSLMGGVASSAPPPPANSSTSQLYKRRDCEDGSLVFQPVATSQSSAPRDRVVPGHMTSSPSHMTEGRDTMPGHVTCVPTEETTGACIREQQAPQTNPGFRNVQVTSFQSPPPPSAAREFPSPGNFPGMSRNATPPGGGGTAKEGGIDPANFANSANKYFPAKESEAKNSKLSAQLDCAANNATPPSSSSSSSSPSSSSNARRRKKKKKPGIAAKFPPATPNPPPSSNISLSGTASPLSGHDASSPAQAALPQALERDMESLDIQEHSNTKQRVLRALRERERSYPELTEVLGMGNRTEELLQCLMKLVEEGKAEKRNEKYWKILDGN